MISADVAAVVPLCHQCPHISLLLERLQLQQLLHPQQPMLMRVLHSKPDIPTKEEVKTAPARGQEAI